MIYMDEKVNFNVKENNKTIIKNAAIEEIEMNKECKSKNKKNKSNKKNSCKTNK